VATLPAMAAALLSCDFSPVIDCDINLSKDDCGKEGFLMASPINTNAFSKYLVKEATAAPDENKLTSAPLDINGFIKSGFIHGSGSFAEHLPHQVHYARFITF
jgi:hypothetical protein